jgi:hypothetical protein
MAHRVVPAALRFAPLLALALLAAGCGKSKERELYEQREAACASVLGLTVSQARPVMLSREDLIICNSVSDPEPLNRIPEGDTCGGAATGPYLEDVCQVYFLFVANDPGLCNDSTGCTYGCEARVNASQVTVVGGALEPADATICARRWVP